MGKNRKIVVNCGTKNPAKLKGIKEAFSQFFDSNIKGFDVPSGVSNQPIGLKQILKGAKNRAIEAYKLGKCDYSVGYEAGIFPFPNKTGYFDTGICVIYDGKDFYYGGSPLFEYPKFIIKKVFEEGKEVGVAMDEHLKSKNTKNKGGVIGHLTDNKIRRSDYVGISVLMAIIALRKKELY